ncbi:MAG: 2Fe-2S iron-sulfur cluster binding domain-containing protein [Chloroflexi bacterium]|nr:MAG: 2Fe-2S iron-sulfur cluster binding domain-containing protein [Chloroflexota bacterium]
MAGDHGDLRRPRPQRGRLFPRHLGDELPRRGRGVTAVAAGVHEVQLSPDGRTFTVQPGETVLQGALRQGVRLNYGCLHGNCSSCKYLLLDGDVDFGIASPYSLPPGEREEGWALLCCATPLCDLEIQSSLVQDPRTLPDLIPEERTSEVVGVEHLGGDLWRLRLELDHPLEFYAGQYVQLGVPGTEDDWRAYSISSPPSRQPIAEFIVKRIEGGRFSGQIDRLATATPLRVRGPYGTGYLRAGSDPVLLVAGGSGIAPIMSILQHAAEQEDPREFRFFFGARIPEEVVLAEEIDGLGRRLPRFSFHPAVEHPGESGWEGETGRVTKAIQRLLHDASPYDVHLCGNPPMCDSASLLLEAKGVREGRVFFDRFHAAV